MPHRAHAVHVPLFYLLLCLLVAGTITACSSSPTPEPSPTAESPLAPSPLPTPVSEVQAPTAVPAPEMPQPDSGNASVLGLLYTYTGHGPIPGTVFYLTPAMGDSQPRPPAVFTGPRAEAGDVPGESDEGGWIALNNIPPGDYYLAVWAPYNWIIADVSDADRNPRLITLEADQQLDLGQIYLSWP